jgi:hypothetical protein
MKCFFLSHGGRKCKAESGNKQVYSHAAKQVKIPERPYEFRSVYPCFASVPAGFTTRRSAIVHVQCRVEKPGDTQKRVSNTLLSFGHQGFVKAENYLTLQHACIQHENSLCLHQTILHDIDLSSLDG